MLTTARPILCLTLLAATLQAHAAAQSTQVFAAPNGHGSICTQRKPCALQSAQQRVRALAPSMQSDIDVSLKPGDYRLTSPLALDARDSGRNGHTIIWRADQKHPVILDGAIRIRKWKLIDREMNLWSAPVPPRTKSLQLFVNGQRAVRARGNGCKSPAQCKYTPAGLAITDPALAQRLSSLRHPEDLVAVFSVRWRDFHCSVASVSATAITMASPCWHNTVIDSKNGWRNASPMGRPFTGIEWFENAYEFLGTPGQFYLDTNASRIYYVPRPGEHLASADVELPIAPSLLTLTAMPAAPIHDIRIEGIQFIHTTWAAPDTPEGYVPLQAGYLVTGNRDHLPDNGEGMTRIPTAVTVLGGADIIFLHDTFNALGTAGIALAGGTRDSAIARSTFTDISGGAIFIGDTIAHPDAPLAKSAHNTVERNTISRIAREYRDNVAIMGGFNDGLIIDRNTIEDTPYTGISVGWGWDYEGEADAQRDIRITRNRLHDFMLDLYDGGAIYTQAQSPGSVVCANFIDFSGTHHANGIYLDERSRDYSVHNNVVWNVTQGDNWLSAWASWSGNLTMTHNWTDDTHLKPHNPGPTKIFGPNFLALKTLPPGASAIIANSGADAPDNSSDPCAY
ncbi:right-handed parallel beta-helix repeat-containing protein [Edaphobacter sp.]|uniref:right-handed parallel beta-helix repeat-containing protein n=1 Tax=Edaphobacter sp. TaxID=1934404 RepID=UPI002DB78E71|nr:right-handed parallel beta-helix repeat-containing protein [Edaphobacter sp.]HEU5341289.1 right-handed parallel beta-helix repeat-containing protein [Edaphobacter sp.]